jgi:hypothetical protein
MDKDKARKLAEGGFIPFLDNIFSLECCTGRLSRAEDCVIFYVQEIQAQDNEKIGTRVSLLRLSPFLILHR